MRKTVYLLVAFCVCGVGMGQAAPRYDYDLLDARMVPVVAENSPYSSFTVTAADDEDVFTMPQGRFNLYVNEIDLGDMILQLQDLRTNTSHELQITKLYQGNVDMQYWEENPITFEFERIVEKGLVHHTLEVKDGDTIKYVNVQELDVPFYKLKVTWKDKNGNLQEKYIAQLD